MMGVIEIFLELTWSETEQNKGDLKNKRGNLLHDVVMIDLIISMNILTTDYAKP